MITVKIDRSKWYRGKGWEFSRLVSEKGNCCLGFLGLQCGFTEKDLRDVSAPAGTVDGHGKWPETIVRAIPQYPSAINGGNTCLCSDMMIINDDTRMSDKLREQELNIRAEKAGIKFVFSN